MQPFIPATPEIGKGLRLGPSIFQKADHTHHRQEFRQTLDQLVPFSANAVEYAKIIKNQATRRLVQGAGREILDLASQETGDVAELLDEAERKVFEIAQKRRTGDLRTMADLMEEALTLLDKMKQSGGGITGVPSGFVDLDNQLTGFQGGELIILAGRPGIGKTSLAMNFALHVAAKENLPIAVFSLEMPSVQLITRLLATHAKVDMKKLRGGSLTPSDEERISESANELFKAKFYVNWESCSEEVTPGAGIGGKERTVLSDPQASGGLLVSCSPEAVTEVLSIFLQQGFSHVSVIGEVVAGKPAIEVF